MEILGDLDTEIRAELWKGLSAKDTNPRILFKQAFYNVLSVMEKTPELSRFSNEDYHYLIRKLPPHLSEEYVNNDHLGFWLSPEAGKG